jgi:hypothetical protein
MWTSLAHWALIALLASLELSKASAYTSQIWICLLKH